MQEWVGYAFGGASLFIAVVSPWLAARAQRGKFEGVIDTKMIDVYARLDRQDADLNRQFGETKATVKDALDRLYTHERELGALSAGLAQQRGYSGR
jgi:hypothetical protein